MNNHGTTSIWLLASTVIALENDYELKRFGLEGKRETSRGTTQITYTEQVVWQQACNVSSDAPPLL
jgi:hypothetical protein